MGTDWELVDSEEEDNGDFGSNFSTWNAAGSAVYNVVDLSINK